MDAARCYSIALVSTPEAVSLITLMLDWK
jgi:hypothetical protein